MDSEKPRSSATGATCAQSAHFTADTSLAAEVIPSPNHSQRRGKTRPDMLVLHYTGMPTADGALKWLTTPESKVSAHYLIDERGCIIQMAPEARRAWHAGVSRWAGETDINSASIGIEIHNPGHDGGYPDFPEPQMRAVEALCKDIVRRHRIKAERVLAHSDVAPMRKRDPGEKFDWERLAKSGVGLWVEPAPLHDRSCLGLMPGAFCEAVGRMQTLLADYGYGIERTCSYDEATAAVVTAFQRHFRPQRVDGRADPSTIATLERLLVAEPGRR